MRLLSLLSAIGLLAASPLALAGKGHTHGEGRLDVVIDKDAITLDLELPLDAVVGFERAPKSDKEKAALADAEKVLQDAAALWLPTPGAKCAVETSKVGMPAFNDGGHADIQARYVFRCTQPGALKSIETTLFKTMKRLYRLETQRVGPVGQGAMRMSPKTPMLVW